MSSVSHIDAAAVKLLYNILSNYKQQGVTLVLANPSDKVMQVLERTDLPEKIGRGNIFVGVHDAVQHAAEQENMRQHQRFDALHRTWTSDWQPLRLTPRDSV